MAVLSLEEVAQHLNITGAEHDAELQNMIEAAEALISKRVGPLEPTTVTVTASSDGYTVVLPVRPVLSLTSMALVNGGSAVDVADYLIDSNAGVVEPIASSRFPSGRYTVTYEAGREECPADLLLAVKEMVRHLWASQRGGARRPGSTEEPVSPSFLIPYAVAELLAPHEQLGFA